MVRFVQGESPPHENPDDHSADLRLGVRLTLAVVAVAIFTMPFVILLVLVKTSSSPLRSFDEGIAVQLHAQALENPDYTAFLNVATEVFGPWTWRGLVLLTAAWLWYRGASRLAVWAVATIAFGGLLNLAVKGIVARARPDLPDPVASAPGAAFPSGHAMGAALGACILVLILLPFLRSPASRIVAWIVAAVVVVFVAYSRVALGVHWTSDVIAGVALGVVVVAGTSVGFEAWRRGEGRKPVEPPMEDIEPEAFR
ncbi:phosphatase PAP2 family protein [Streptosporangium sp. NBC_01755]|uniref:phosphatase PAP2 family protein n=1 Tax=unclassified Streptosporangium TaxID=2632669 RepID=UPI002DDC3C46|nr:MULTISPECIES: phosphatase PAP2 family protein [unclassified Streptosporangium]WSA25697.1 phosphatase PAP2 family protein [Streptosporangium sp. NBC_01810]WSD02913.1 phosphatase PAP2 family protein [Streptosporangium sp. NBC_01755]